MRNGTDYDACAPCKKTIKVCICANNRSTPIPQALSTQWLFTVLGVLPGDGEEGRTGRPPSPPGGGGMLAEGDERSP